MTTVKIKPVDPEEYILVYQKNPYPSRKLLYDIAKEIVDDKKEIKKEIASILAGWKLIEKDPYLYNPICEDTTKYRLSRLRTNINIYERLYAKL